MSDTAVLGAKVRAVRRQHRLTQKQMADRLGISASYLNLIENGKRPLSANVLIALATRFSVDISTFAEDDTRAEAELTEVLGDPLFDDIGLTTGDIREVVGTAPAITEAVLTLYRAYREARDTAATAARGERAAGLGTGIAHPADEVSDFIQRAMNHFPALEAAAERLCRAARVTEDNRYGALVRWLEDAHNVQTRWVPVDASGVLRRFEPGRRLLFLSQMLPPRSRHFQVAHQLALLEASDILDDLVDHRCLTTDESRKLARVALANYFAGAVLMPYGPFLEEARQQRYDIELLGHRFRTSFEQVCHRLTTLRRPGAEGIPFHLIRVDVAGNISKRFSGSGIRFARYSGACPKWNVHLAFLTPGQLRIQTSVMEDDTTYFCIARTVQRSGSGWKAPHALHAIGLGCAVDQAAPMVYADGYDLHDPSHAVPVGITCRLCERLDCPQRAFGPQSQRLQLDENIRAVNLYTPSTDP